MKINMKRFIGLLFLLISVQTIFAQSDYISCSPQKDMDYEFPLFDDGGILILSKRNDLVVTVVNASGAKIEPNGRRDDGFYEYKIVINPNVTPNPKVEVNRRGDVNRAEFVTTLKPNFFKVYMVEEVPKPIRMENLSQANDAILNADSAEVEISSAIPDLKVVFSKDLQATLDANRQSADENIRIYSVRIPVRVLQDARNRMETTAKAYESLYKKLVDDAPEDANVSDSEWEKLSALETEMQEAQAAWDRMTMIDIYAENTNRLQIDISSLGPRSKLSYGVLLLKTVEYVTEYSARMAEGARLFNLRKYDEARRAFSEALKTKDTPDHLIPAIQSNINQCDTCILYYRYATYALLKMKEMQEKGTANQEEVVRYASGAEEFLQVLNKYNPCDFYSERIDKLNKIIEEMPLDIKFTVTKWVNNISGFYEAGGLANVELWGYAKTDRPLLKSYGTDKRFKNLVDKSEGFTLLGKTDEKGEVILHLDRKNLPKGIFFRPVGYDNKIKIEYLYMVDIMRQSKDEFNMRQFRLKMYTANK